LIHEIPELQIELLGIIGPDRKTEDS